MIPALLSALGGLKNLPWRAIGAGLAVVGVCWFFYAKGRADMNAKWVARENARIIRETDARIKSLSEKAKLDIEQAAANADRLARAEERAKAERERADSAIENQNKIRRSNYALAQSLKTAQSEAAMAGDQCGPAPLPDGVRAHFKNRLDALRRGRSAPAGLRDQDRSAPAADAGAVPARRATTENRQ